LDFFPLTIFPQGSLSSSVIPTVLVGVFVVCFFNMRLGWVMTGLIVPGYLVPLILIKPWAAGVVFLEAFTTYFLVWFFSEYSSRFAPWANLFGRDRFFALLLCSILVRLLFDGLLLPAAGAWANDYLQIGFDYRNQLHSFGLIIVALIANQFWKTGFVKGLWPLFVTVGITLLIVRYGLMALTNFSLSNVGYLYEDMASSILATPKAYIILISTAYLASRMNLKYGWDFNGILIPALLALQWYQPMKILATLVEAGLILILASWLLKTAWLQKTSIEGASKLLLFFNVSFAYKFVLGYVILWWFPAIKVTDYYGFGYMLATLMALKIHDQAIFVRLTRATIQISFTAVIIASVIGFGLTRLPISTWLSASTIDSEQLVETNTLKLEASLSELLKQEQVRLYQTKANSSFVLPQVADIENFSTAISLLKKYINTAEDIYLQQASIHLSKANYQLGIVQNRYLYLREKEDMKGWGTYVIDMKSESQLSLAVPATLDEISILGASVALFQSLEAKSLAISGSSRHERADIGADVLQNRQSFFHQFHRIFNRNDSLQVRAYSDETARQLLGQRRLEGNFDIKGLETTLWVKQQFPESLDLVHLKKLIDQFQVDWDDSPFVNIQRDLSNSGFAELFLTQEDIRKLMFRPMLLDMHVSVIEKDLSIEGYLQDWILSRKGLIASKGSELYIPPNPEDLLFFDEQVLTPLIAAEKKFQLDGNIWSAQNIDDLRVINRAARIIGYQVIRYHHRKSGQEYLLLTEREDVTARHWGTYVLRVGESAPYIIQVTRPIYEINSFEYGVALYERFKAKYLMLSTSHPYANADGSANLISIDNKVNLFNLFNQVVLRESLNADMMVVSSRAFTYYPDKPIPEADVLLAFSQGRVQQQNLTPLESLLISTIKSDGMTIKLVDGSSDTIGYEVGTIAQSLYLRATENKSFAVLWMSPDARFSYKQQSENTWQIAQFSAMDIAIKDIDLALYMSEQHFFSSVQLDEVLKDNIATYIESPDVIRLEQIKNKSTQLGYTLQRLLDISSKQAFISIHDKDGNLLAVANLSPRTKRARNISLEPSSGRTQDITNFIDQREFWLLGRHN